jgi:Kef-type K+ transport system membrane component KefB
MNRAAAEGAAIGVPRSDTPRPTWQITCLYLTMLVVAVGAFLAIQRVGEGLIPIAAANLPSASVARSGLSSMVQILVSLVTIVSAAQLFGRLFVKFKQPAVVGEIVAGLVLGPSLLGTLAPAPMQWLLPSSVAPVLSALSQVGVILYMFLIGIELDTSSLRRRSHASVAISHASIAVPFLMGACLALVLFPSFGSRGVSFTPFALFCGVAMAVTAFPVLARILRDRGMLGSRLGAAAIACAVVDDVTAWCLLAFVVGCVNAEASSAGLTLVLALSYVALMFTVVKPGMKRAMSGPRRSRATQTLLALVLIALLVSSLATELIGVHAIFGSFLMGAVLPRDSQIASEIRGRIEDLVVVLLLPIFFAYTGTRVQVGLLGSVHEWLMCALVVITACAGKFGGTALTARFTGFAWRDAAILGTLMNTRGLVELIVLNIGRDLGILSPTLFAMFVLMAVITTAMTSPVLSLIERWKSAPRGELTPVTRA